MPARAALSAPSSALRSATPWARRSSSVNLVFRAHFPDGAGEMCGGGGWDPGEATDDTQMAVLVGESLLDQGGLEPADLFRRFQRWAAGEPKDIGLQTEQVLTSGDPWDTAAGPHFA
jgi:hypothetical protein